jgi:KipI family sensor histidine kinase inhibitor
MRIVRASDQAFLVVFDDGITERGSTAVRRLHALLTLHPVAGQVDLHPAYGSLLVRFEATGASVTAVGGALRARAASIDEAPAGPTRTIDIPVRYGGDDGPDLELVARATGLTEAEVVLAHASASYEVAFLGFSPGFPYLSGLPERLAAPRQLTPRRRVPAGSVAIAGAQAGIYPLASAGGWNLIGRTEAVLFDATRMPPALLAPGDRVRFVRVPRDA